jgi:starch synthase
MSEPMRVLHVAAEAFPLVKTGGLADVATALPVALNAAGAGQAGVATARTVEARLLLPAYPAVREALAGAKKVCDLGTVLGAARVQLLHARMPGNGLPLYLVHAPSLFGREGGPYQDAQGQAWPDNAQRFALLGWVAAQMLTAGLDEAWQPELVHAHDWHAGLACAYLHAQGAAARSLFTIHNLAFQGLFPLADAPLLGLPSWQTTPQGLEFHGQGSFMKAALSYARRITTVSPSYAREITTDVFGAGLDGVLRNRVADLSGILNGIDEGLWNPATDTALVQRYDVQAMQGKAQCKAALQAEFGLSPQPQAPLFAVVGEGEPALQEALATAARLHPAQLALRLGYDEARAHRIIAGADVVLVPSRFEPCGLTQMYALRYGSLPLVRRVGGLADTVSDASEAAGTGFVFDAADGAALWGALESALALWHKAPAIWAQMRTRGMAQPLGWQDSARRYAELYRSMLGQGL